MCAINSTELRRIGVQLAPEKPSTAQAPLNVVRRTSARAAKSTHKQVKEKKAAPKGQKWRMESSEENLILETCC